MNNDTVVLTNIGVTGKSNCTGVTDIKNDNTIFSNIMCKYTEVNGDTNFNQFTTDRGTASSGVNSFVVY